jgi:ferredoxin
MKIYITNYDKTMEAAQGANLLEVLRAAGFGPDAPCGGKGTCGKCKVLVDGVEVPFIPLFVPLVFAYSQDALKTSDTKTL